MTISQMIIFFLLILLMPYCVKAQTPAGALAGDRTPKANRIRAEVLDLEERGRLRSLKGETNWDDMMIDGAYLISPDGAIFRYKKGRPLPSIPLKDFRITELIARVYGDAVVVTGLATIDTESSAKLPISIQMRYMNVWRRSEGKWKMAVTERTVVRDASKALAQ